MYFLRNVFFVTTLLYFFVNQTLSDRQSLMREKGSNSDIASVVSPRDLSLAANVSQKISTLPTNVSSNQSIASEGGLVSSTLERPHGGREHVIEAPSQEDVINKPVASANETVAKSDVIKPDQGSSLAVFPHKDDGKPSVGKKGVNMPAFDEKLNHSNMPHNTNFSMSKNISDANRKVSIINNSANIPPNHNSSTNSSVIYKKPKVTELDTDHITNSKEDNSKENDISIDQIDLSIVDKKNKSSDYIVPIVAVILSVPLVAILMSVIYKRGTDWWQHRNYKRMDFLIEGMYHN